METRVCTPRWLSGISKFLRYILLTVLAVVVLSQRMPPVPISAAFPQTASPSSAKTSADEMTPLPESLAIKPAAIAILAGEPQTLHLVDNRGRPIKGAVWTVSNATLANVEGDGDATLVGLAPGKLTVTATWRNLVAQAKVTILGEPVGTTISQQGPSESRAEPGRFDITPDEASMLVGETRSLTLFDFEENHRVPEAEWTVSDPTVATVKAGPDATVTALAPGKVTVTARWQGNPSEAQITVYPGSELPPGTVKWSVKSRPGYRTKANVIAMPH